jgi:hypothetical protein
MLRARANVVSTFLLIKGALIRETRDVLRQWDSALSVKANLAAFKTLDLGGVGSANWRRDVAFVLQRRFDLAGADHVLCDLAKSAADEEVWRAVLLYHMTRDEFLLRDFLTSWLAAKHAEGVWRIHPQDVGEYLDALRTRAEVVVKEKWSARTTHDVQAALLRYAVEFGLMKGLNTREFISYHVPEGAFLYLLRAMQGAEQNTYRLVHNEDWRLYLMTSDDVERELFRLHQLGKLHYQVAGSVAELRLPHSSALDFVRAEWGEDV